MRSGGPINAAAHWCKVAATIVVMFACSAAMLLASAATLFRRRQLVKDRILAPCARFILRIWGLRYVVHQPEPFPRERAVFISNHPSTIDIFLLLALGLPNTRFFLWGGLRRNPLIALIGYLIGVFWTVSQKFPEQRRIIFERAERALRRTGESVFLCPEGRRVPGGTIGDFNKGAFHLSANLGAPLVPIFIAIPQAIDPGRGTRAKPGTVHVYFKPVIETANWNVSDLLIHKENVRDLFVRWNAEHRM